jgi:CyaY protein
MIAATANGNGAAAIDFLRILTRRTMTESEFNDLVDRVFAVIGEALDDTDGDCDWILREGVLEIECPDGSKLILNRHLPNREIWLAAKSGGYHYRPENGAWTDTRRGEALPAMLKRALREQAGASVEFVLPAQ